jgi:hypothetical protein
MRTCGLRDSGRFHIKRDRVRSNKDTALSRCGRIASSMLGPCFQKMQTNAHREQCLGLGPGHISSGTLSINTVIDSYQWCCVISRRSLYTPLPNPNQAPKQSSKSSQFLSGSRRAAVQISKQGSAAVGRYNRHATRSMKRLQADCSIHLQQLLS